MVARQKRAVGAWEVRRTLAVPALSHAADAAAVEKALRDLPGLLESHADPGHRTVQVHYDITCCDYRGVESTLELRAASEGPNSTIPENLIRVSVGLEAAEDLLEDLRQALA